MQLLSDRQRVHHGTVGRSLFSVGLSALLLASLVTSARVPPARAATIAIDRSVAAASDDAEEYANGGVTLDSTDLELVRDGGHGDQVVGVRFADLQVPRGATITAASVQFEVDEATSAATSLTIRAQAADHASTFSTSAGNISSRTVTTASVAWSPAAWPTVGARGAAQATPNLATLVHEVVSRPGWVAGNAVVVIIRGTGARVAEAFGGPFAPRLHVEYEGGTTPPSSPTITGLSPTSGLPGASVSISGTNLSGVTTVRFNGLAASFSVLSAGSIQATVPAGATSGTVTVESPAGSAASPTPFTIQAPPSGGILRVPQDYATIQAAVNAAIDGEKVIVSPGTYREAVVISGKRITLGSDFALSGDANTVPITVILSDTAQPAILVEASAADSSIVGLSLLVDPNATVSPTDGIKALASFTVLSSRIIGFADGIDLEPPNPQAPAFATIVENLIENNSDDAVDFDGASAGRVESNTLRNNGDDGMEIRLHDVSARLDILLRGNSFSGNGQDGLQIIDEPGVSNRHFTIDRNVFSGNARAGMGLLAGGNTNQDYSAASLLDPIYLFNNTFSGNNHGLTGGDNLVAVNNIFARSTNLGVKGVDGGSIVAHSLFWSNGTNTSTTNLDASSTRVADPLLAADFTLQPGSPAIDAGVASYTHNGVTVLDLPAGSYQGSAPDLGAHEASPGSPPQDTTPPDTTITGGPSGTVTSTAASFTYSSTEAGSTFACSLDGASFTSCPASGISYTALATGPHTFAVGATDPATNPDASPASRGWTIEPSAPGASPVNLGELGRATSTTSSTTLTIPVSAAAAAGSTVVVGIGHSGASSIGVAISDSAGNVYRVDVRRDNGTSSGSTGAIASSRITNPLGAGASITVRLTAAASQRMAIAYAYSGLAGPDRTASGTGVSAAPASGLAGPIQSTPQLVVGLSAWSSTATHTAGGGMTERAELHAGTRSLAFDERIVTSPGSYGDSGTLSASVRWTDSVATYAPSASGPPQDTTPPDTTITGGPSGTVTSTAASFTYSSTEAGSTFACSLDGASFTSCPASGISYTALATGPHTFAVGATDPATNPDASPASRGWTIEPSAPGAVVLVGAGDIASCGSSGDEATAMLLDGIAGTVFTTGDNVYDGPTLQQYQNCYGPSWGRHLARTRPAAGNHDYDPPGAQGYYAYFGSSAGDPTKGYYSYDLGAWHVVVLNSNCTAVACGADSVQEQWLRADLAASGAACTVAIWHHPRFSVGVHGDDPATQPFWEALYEAGAELVLNGHDHNYQRFLALGADGQPDPTFGLRSFVVGTGGVSHYATALGPNTVVANGTTYGVLKLTLSPGSYDFAFVPVAEGTFTDAGSGTCHGAPTLPPDDTTPPNTTIASGPANPTTSSSATFTFSSTEAGSTFACSLDGTAFVTCTSPRTYTGLGAAAHSFQVRATDPAGNTDLTPAQHAWTITGGGGAVTTFTAEADAEIRAATPNGNFGTLTGMVVDASPATDAYVRFTVSGISGTVTSAKLRLHAFGATTNGPRVLATGSGWSETGITWNQRPSDGALIANLAAVARNTWVEIDVTAAVTANGTYSFHLAPDGSDGLDLYTREAALRPELVVTTSP